MILRSGDIIMPTQTRPDAVTAIAETGRSKPSGSARVDAGCDFRLQLSARLQSTLDLPEMLSNFFHISQTAVPSSGMEYSFEHKQVRVSLGSRRAHSARYNLLNLDGNLGEIIFHRAHRFSEQELQTLETLMSFLVMPLRNALLYRDAVEHSLTDSLTGLGNRTALDSALKREYLLAVRSDTQLSIVVVDIDHFKKVNDSAGHSTGDALIRKVAEMVLGSIRQTDRAFRFGGEEYVVLLADTPHGAAMAVAERVRSAVAEIRLSTAVGPLTATVSAGVSTLRSDDSAHTLFERADAALFLAKSGGRNAVVSAESIAAPKQSAANTGSRG